MRLPEPRGPLSEALFRDLATRTTLSATTIERGDRVATAGACALTDEDLQISLADCYELHSRGFDGVADDWEWDPALLRLRASAATPQVSYGIRVDRAGPGSTPRYLINPGSWVRAPPAPPSSCGRSVRPTSPDPEPTAAPPRPRREPRAATSLRQSLR
ncbi:MAG: hypothetical protein ACXVHI_03045 [Frankiaceae bacterium]